MRTRPCEVSRLPTLIRSSTTGMTSSPPVAPRSRRALPLVVAVVLASSPVATGVPVLVLAVPVVADAPVQPSLRHAASRSSKPTAPAASTASATARTFSSGTSARSTAPPRRMFSCRIRVSSAGIDGEERSPARSAA